METSRCCASWPTGRPALPKAIPGSQAGKQVKLIQGFVAVSSRTGAIYGLGRYFIFLLHLNPLPMATANRYLCTCKESTCLVFISLVGVVTKRRSKGIFNMCTGNKERVAVVKKCSGFT